MQTLMTLLTQFLFVACFNSCIHSPSMDAKPIAVSQKDTSILPNLYADTVLVPYDVQVGHYFKFMDSLVKIYTPSVSYYLSEHLLVRTNSWIIDSFIQTDYYSRKARGIFILTKLLKKKQQIFKSSQLNLIFATHDTF
jgi:hypothetical protein